MPCRWYNFRIIIDKSKILRLFNISVFDFISRSISRADGTNFWDLIDNCNMLRLFNVNVFDLYQTPSAVRQYREC